MRRYIVKGQNIQPIVKRFSLENRKEMTPEEDILWQALRNSQIGVRFRRQQIIVNFIADFYCHEHGLIVEADGSQHSQETDGERDAVIKSHNLRILRFSNYRILNEFPEVLAEIKANIVAK